MKIPNNINAGQQIKFLFLEEEKLFICNFQSQSQSFYTMLRRVVGGEKTDRTADLPYVLYKFTVYAWFD